MTASELRLGNLILFRGNLICLDTNYELFKSLVDISRNDKRYKPIQLTEEWLLEFGFEKIKDFDVYTNVWELGGFIVSLGEYYINIHVDWADYGDDNYHSIVGYEELHVHTLQNLYFSLTGEELTFKSE